MAFFLELFDHGHGAALAVFFGLERGAFAGVLQHREVVQRDVGAAPGIGRGRQVVGVGFTGHLEDGDGDLFLDFGAAGEPLGIGPALHDFFGLGVARLGFFGDVVEEVEHQEGFLQAFGGHSSHFGAVEQFDQGVHVVTAHHGAQQLGGLGFGDQAHADFAVRDRGQKGGLDFGSVVHARWHAVGQEVQQESVFACGRVFDQLDQFGGLLGIQRQWRNAKGCAFGGVVSVGFQHGFSPVSQGFKGYRPMPWVSNRLGGGLVFMASATAN